MLTRFKKITILAMSLVLAFGVLTPLEVDAAKKKTKNPVVAVVDNDYESARDMIKVLRKCNITGVWVWSDNIDPTQYDGLVIPGGHNIDPRMYGAERSEYTYGTDIEKDRVQIKAVQDFANANRPVLGICRGCQVVNVAFGGTINQHIPGWHKYYRWITIKRRTWLSGYYGRKSKVYHFHHQCVDQLGYGLVATAWDKKDGHIEGFQHRYLPVYGVQWHPDHMGRRGYGVFKAFRSKCLTYRTKNAKKAKKR